MTSGISAIEFRAGLIERDESIRKTTQAYNDHLQAKNSQLWENAIKRVEKIEEKIEKQKARHVVFHQKLARYNKRKANIRAFQVAAFKTACTLVVTLSPFVGALNYL